MANADIQALNADKASNKLIRRARLRQLLLSHQGLDGFSSRNEIAEAMGVHPNTIYQDLRDIGALKVTAKIGGVTARWYILPAHNPNLPEYRTSMQQEDIENEVAYKINAHVLITSVIGHEVVLRCERSAGPLVSDWLSLLDWPEILHVSEERSACVIKTGSVEDATLVHARLIGGDPEGDDDAG